MTKEIRNPNPQEDPSISDSDFAIRHSFVIRHSSFVIGLSLAWLWSCCVVPAFAGAAWTPRFAVDPPWTTEKGLPQNSVISLLQTRDGYLWVGTGYGLARFDGIHFKTFDDTDAPGLNSGKIVRLCEDSRGYLWIGTEAA